MVIVGLPGTLPWFGRLDEVTGCSFSGASTIAGARVSGPPSGNELAGARFQVRHVALIAQRLAVWRSRA